MEQPWWRTRARDSKGKIVCRNIKTLFNFKPAATRDEIHAASEQFVRKISGFSKPSKANEAAFASAVDEITAASARFLVKLQTRATPRNRRVEALKAKKRAAQRFGTNKAA